GGEAFVEQEFLPSAVLQPGLDPRRPVRVGLSDALHPQVRRLADVRISREQLVVHHLHIVHHRSSLLTSPVRPAALPPGARTPALRTHGHTPPPRLRPIVSVDRLRCQPSVPPGDTHQDAPTTCATLAVRCGGYAALWQLDAERPPRLAG